ncbi:Lrp/AsnC family transcriptional regulator [Streptomyces sp. SID11385]|uniref:Lrp/AsnC ligand binding domain-containing protein n=1 Tax=Streptomyces sp. SID11385 TaxID=2706031 RepID=UPI0013C8D033|nr:Lrp/AsnC family transcriptional regulator [Streptomyces sp. SID11385]
MPKDTRIDPTDARLLLALSAEPRATTVALAERTGLSRNTVQARLAALDRDEAVASFERRVDPAALGYPLTAFVTTHVAQRLLDEVAAALAAIPEVVQVHGLTGESDLLVHVVARDAEDLYRVAGQILARPGVERTNTALVMRQLVEYRMTPLLRRAAGGGRAASGGNAAGGGGERGTRHLSS